MFTRAHPSSSSSSSSSFCYIYIFTNIYVYMYFDVCNKIKVCMNFTIKSKSTTPGQYLSVVFLRYSIYINYRSSKSADGSVDRTQGSTHLPKFPCVEMKKPAEYSRTLTMNDVPKIR